MSEPNQEGITEYVVGLMFNENKEKILLIMKERPEWQKGLLNGIGGKIEKGENPFQCMVREFKEEVGIETTIYDWIHYLTISNDKSFIVHFFYCFSDKMFRAKAQTDEIPIIIPVKDIKSFSTINNLQYLIPLLLIMVDEEYYIASRRILT